MNGEHCDRVAAPVVVSVDVGHGGLAGVLLVNAAGAMQVIRGLTVVGVDRMAGGFRTNVEMGSAP